MIWTFFTSALSQATQSLVEQQHMLTRVYFPRVLLPVASVIGAGFDVLLSLPILIGMMLFYGIVPSTAIVTLPLFLVLAGRGTWSARTSAT